MSEVIDVQPEDKRPVILLVAAILSFISIGLSAIGLVISLFIGPMNEDQILESRVDTAKQKTELRNAGGPPSFIRLMDQMQAMAEEANEKFYLATGLNFLTTSIGFIGVLFMMRRRKLGFHLYIVYSLLSLGAMYLYISPQNIPTISLILGLIFSGIFVFMYSRALKWMR